MDKLDMDIKIKRFSNIYLIFGTENYLKEKYEKILTSAILDDNFSMMNFAKFDEKSFDISKVIEACDTLTFMSNYRLVILKDCNIFNKKQDIEILDKYLENMPKTTILVILEEKIDKRQKIFNTIFSLGYVCELEPLTEDKMLIWLKEYFNKNGKNINQKTALYFLRNISSDMEFIINEANKIIAYQDERDITIDSIDNICTKSVESKIFNLIDFIGQKNTKEALKLYRSLINNKTSPFLILNMIARQLKIILQVKYLAKENSINQIAKELGLREFIVRGALAQSKNFRNNILLEAINECLNIDIKIKTGQGENILLVELFIIKYTT